MATEYAKQNPHSACLPLKSGIKGIVWPAFQDSRYSQLLALQFFLDQNQWLAPEEIETRQFLQCGQLLQHAFETVPYYRNKFDGCGFDGGDKLTRDNWSQLPILKRLALQENFEELQSASVPAGHGNTALMTTSGSTGTPVSVRKTMMSDLYFRGIELRNYYWHGIDPGQDIALIRFLDDPNVAPLPHGRHAEHWGDHYQTLFNTGQMDLLAIDSPVAGQAAWLMRIQPQILVTAPSNLLQLSRFMGAEDQHLTRLQRVITLSETLDADMRGICERFFQAPIVDMYSCQEAGYLALQCPAGDHYHVQSESVLLEILDEHGRPCAPGETGRVVITDLHNFAMPLIRYEIGDFAVAGAVCDCGRGLPVLRAIQGRVRNMLTLPNGDTLWPRLRSQTYSETAGVRIRQAQIVQHALDDIEVRLVVESPLKPEQEARLVPLIQAALGHPFPLRFSYPDVIARGRGGKFEEFVSRLA